MIEYYDKPIIHMMEQNSEEWDAIRLGKITASPSNTLLVHLEKKLGAGAVTYAFLKAGESIKKRPVKESFSSKETNRGHEFEPLARDAYEEEYFQTVKQVGFVQCADLIGCSPDGLIGENGGWEAKCFRLDNHLKILRQFKKGKTLIEVIGKDKYAQVQFSMFVTKRDWWDICFFNPYANHKKLIVKRIERDEKMIDLFKLKCEMLVKEIHEIIELDSPDFVELKKVA